MILIPGGTFMMGAGTDEDYSPIHKVTVSSFFIDVCEVTNEQYARFCEETGHRLPDFWGLGSFRCGPAFPKHPVVTVSWIDATMYAEWCGKRLPTEAEWEYAARGGLEGKRFPHGDTLDPSAGNYAYSGHGGPIAVGSYPANGFGLHDMQGNVVEWVADSYDPGYYAVSPQVNPTGPEPTRYRVIRGGGWHSGVSCNQVFWRHALVHSWVDFNVGFRCVRETGED
jgi:iron(II)-dependent oxidoreductase